MPSANCAERSEGAYQRTLDLAALARIERGDRIELSRVHDRTQELFDKTLQLVGGGPGGQHRPAPTNAARITEPRFVPLNEDLRKLYLFAEALGGYEILNHLINAYSPARRLSSRLEREIEEVHLEDSQIARLEDYERQINQALENASVYLSRTTLHGFSQQELLELNEILLAASERAKLVTRILGASLIRQVEEAVATLSEFHEKIKNVHKTLDGIFLVDAELMFIPTNALIRCVNVMFKALGNPYVADHIDGVLLLAARNLLIEAVSFYSYYGRQQIYDLCQKAGATVNTRAIADHIRHEIHKLFSACQTDNRLVLRRVMRDAEREFEISARAIEAESIRSAVSAVKQMLPPVPKPPPPRRSWLRRALSWLLG